MKKFLKLQAKKSLSLFLAVVMLMSCWVWIAPERAAAADPSPEDGWYYVIVKGKLDDYASSDETATNKWTIKTAQGDYVLTSGDIYNNGGNDMSLSHVHASGWVKGFPTDITHEFARAVDSCNKAKGNGFGVRGATIWVGNGSTISTQVTNDQPDTGYTAQDGSYSGTQIHGGWKADIAPYNKEFKNLSGAVETKTLSIPALGSSGTVSHTFSGAGVYDQYGVKIKAAEAYFISTDETGTVECSKDPESDTYYGVYNESNTSTKVIANADAQVKHSNKNGSNMVYLIAMAGTDKQAIAKITLTYPSYTVTVKPDGSISNLGAVMNMKTGTKTGDWTITGPYSFTASDGNYPTGEATKSGYTFKGFWTVKQPTEGDAGVTASEEAFAEPVSSDDFVNIYGGTAGAQYVTKEGKQYFNAGIKWDAELHQAVSGAYTFYGWWVPKDITVKFYDIDGTYLGSQNAKFGDKPAATWYPVPKKNYVAGAFTYETFSGKWRDITGAIITEGVYEFGEHESLTLTPIYTKTTYKSEYQVNFVDPADGSFIDVNDATNGVGSGKYSYRHILSGANIPSGLSAPNVLVVDRGYSYEFTGWSSQVPDDGANYLLVDADDTSFTENTDWVVREDITYYAVFRRTVKEYVVAFQYTDSTGTEKTEIHYVPYGSAISTPNTVNRTYAAGGYGFTLEGWDYKKNSNTTTMLDVNGALEFNESNVYITDENLKGANPEKPITFIANYDEGQSTPYTVTFKYKDANGNDRVITDSVYHGSKIPQTLVNKLEVVPAQYSDGKALYTFANEWKVTEGTAGKTVYTKDEFTSFGPESHVTFEAIYGEGVPYYTVTYHDGALSYTEKVLKGENVPVWTVETTDAEGVTKEEVYVPKDYEDEKGTYEFAGWFDEKQTDKEYKETNGTEYTTDSIVDADLDLYAQYIFEPFKFTIKFMNFDGIEVLAEGEFEAGDSFKDIYTAAVEKAENRAADKEYSYAFIGWDYKVPDNYLCEGKEMTYIAQYRPNHIYYKARWYNDIDAMNGADLEMELVGEDGLLAITNHTYDGAVYAPSVTLTPPAAENVGESMVFKGWCYIGADGKEHDYQRGMKITDAMYFYATYKSVKDAVTVTVVIDENTTETYFVEYGEKLENVGTPVDGYVDADYHKDFAGWYADAACANEFDMETAITTDTTIYAKFIQEEHNKELKELVTAPTYYAKGEEKIWCACSRADTEETSEIPMLTDTVAPTGTIYLGTQGSWSSTDTVGAAATDNDPVVYYANDNTDIILTINDSGDVNNAYNPTGIGKGIKTIRGIISTGVFGADTTEIAGIQTILTDDTDKLNNTANYVIRLGTYEGLVDGETYIAYYYASDKANNELNRNVRTAKFIYDITAPEFEISGDNNNAAAGAVTYCGSALIEEIEDGAILTVNGDEKAYSDGSFAITEAGNYLVTVTDKAGNSTSKKIKVTAGHNEVKTSEAATCIADGYEKITCAVCNKVIKNEVIVSDGHKYGRTDTIEPTCTEAGYDIKVCSVCGDEVKSNERPAAGHTYEKDEDNNIIYTVITAATCQEAGKKIANCTVCSKGTITVTIPADDENGHVYGAVKTLKATCEDAGEKYQNCKYCYTKKTVEEIAPLNHSEQGTYTRVTLDATCHSEGEKITYCKSCDEQIGKAEKIPTTAHILKLVKYDTDADKSDEYPRGYTQYECQADGCTHTERKEAIADVVKAQYSVTFVGAGENGADLVITKTEGESIAKNEVYATNDNGEYVLPEKASDNESNYTFKGWMGTDGKVINLPLTVTKDEIYTVEFKSSKRIYTHKFLVAAEDVVARTAGEDEEFAIIIGGYNDANKKPVAEPTKKGTTTMKYEFAGWSLTKGGEVVNNEIFTMTEDRTFYAVFNEVPVKFSVLFYDEDKTTIIWNTVAPESDAFVQNGASYAKYNNVVDNVLVRPEKDPDAAGHYTFAGWKYGTSVVAIDALIGPIEGTTRVYATYEVAAHNYKKTDDKKDATCTEAGYYTEKCEVCGYEKVTDIPALGHNWIENADGSKDCSRCDAYVAPETKLITVTTFESVTYGEATMPTVTELEVTDEVPEKSKFNLSAPEKETTAEYEFAFVCWVDADGNVISEDAECEVTLASEDAEFTAVYTATVRIYNVFYIGSDNKVINGYKFELPYGSVVPAAPAEDPAKKSTANDHYIFEGWSVAAGTRVEKSIQIEPIFSKQAHDYQTIEGVPPTCTEPGGSVTKCAICGDVNGEGTKPATGHDYKIVEKVEATYDKEGFIKYECQNDNCPADEKIKIEPIAKLSKKTLTVIVTENGVPVTNFKKVQLYKDGAQIAADDTDPEGKVVFTGLMEGEYIILVDGKSVEIPVNKDTIYTFEIAEDAEDDNNGGNAEPSCSCSCHRSGFWGIVFRLFHNIIKFFTGEVRCCADPDSRY